MRTGIGNAWVRDVAAAATVSLALGGVLGTVGVRAAEEVASNLDLMTQLTAEVFDELYPKFQERLDGRALALRAFSSGEPYVFVENVLASELMERGVGVQQSQAPAAAPPALYAAADSNSSAAEAGYVLQYQTISFGISYADVYRSHMVGGKHVRRRADVRLLLTLSDAANGRVLWIGEAARSREDEFDHADAARIEQGTYQFARPVMPSSGWGRYAEPVFVTAIIVGLIYLFFSNQSDN